MDPVLELDDRRSAVWLKLKKHLEARLALLRARNDNHVDERKTAHLRGCIADVKYILSLGEGKTLAAPEEDLPV